MTDRETRGVYTSDKEPDWHAIGERQDRERRRRQHWRSAGSSVAVFGVLFVAPVLQYLGVAVGWTVLIAVALVVGGFTFGGWTGEDRAQAQHRREWHRRNP